MINKLIEKNSEKISPQKPVDFEFKEGSKKALKKAKNTGLNIYVVSNQPDVSKDWRGLNEYKLSKIDEKMFENGVDDVFYCTHGPLGDQATKKYRDNQGDIVVCDCRKPQPGLLNKVYSKYNLNLRKTVFVGDKKRDILAAKKFENSKNSDFNSKIKIGGGCGIEDKKMQSLLQVVEEEIL